MANKNALINVSIALATVQLQVQGYSTLLIVSDGASFSASGVVRTYANADEIAADGDLSSDLVDFASQAFANDLAPAQIKIAQVAYSANLLATTELDAVVANDDDWYGLIVHSDNGADGHSDANIGTTAAWIELREKLYFAQNLDAALLAGTGGNVGEDLSTADYDRTVLFYHDDNTEALALQVLSQFLAVDPDAGKTIVGWTQVSGISPPTLTSTQISQLDAYNANYLTSVQGIQCVQEGKVASGEWVDPILSRDYLQQRIREDIARAIAEAKAAGSHIPYTNAGLALLMGIVESRLVRAEKAGHLRPGSGVVTNATIESVSAGDISARVFRLEFSGILAGAIQSVNFTGVLTVS